MLECVFELNGKTMSKLKLGGRYFNAFSGLGAHVNKITSVCFEGVGAIPPGKYYIFDRQSGGLLGSFRDLFNDHDTWFALHAIDNKIDDTMYCNKVKRGAFRLHPKSGLGISQGCITIEHQKDFSLIRSILKNQTPQAVLGSKFKAYGVVIVK